MTKKYTLHLRRGLIPVLILAILLGGMLQGCGGDSASNPAKIGSAGAFSRWFSSARKNSLANTETPGTYYFKLTRDIKLGDVGTIRNGHTVYIDLNGHTITNRRNTTSQAFCVSEGASLSLVNGAIEMVGANSDGGLLAVDGNNCALLLENVTLTNTDDSHIPDNLDGGVLYANSPADGDPAVVTMKGTSVINGSPSGLRHNGGAVVMEGNAEFHMCGGAIQNGTAGTSGNIHLKDQSQFYLQDGIISSGNAVNHSRTTGFGGNIGINGCAALHMFGGRITDGKSGRSGGNIYLSGYGPVEADDGIHIYGGIIESGSASSNGGNIFASDKTSLIHMHGGCMENGIAPNGGNIYLEGAALVMRGGIMSAADAADTIAFGGNVFSMSGSIALFDGTIQGGRTTDSGANIYANDTTIDIYGGTITDGITCTKDVSTGGGNIFAGGDSVFNLYGGEIRDGVCNVKKEKVSAAGANVMIAGNTTMEMFGGSIKNGMIYGNIARGGGVYVYGQVVGTSCSFNMYGGEIENGLLCDGTFKDEKMRGMSVAAYCASKPASAEKDGWGIARIFDGTVTYTGPDDSPDKRHTFYSNRSSGLYIYDETKFSGLHRGATVGACPDPSHYTEAGSEAATCVTPGYTKYTCSTCGDWCKITEAATGHVDASTTAVPATETMRGYTEHSCSACSAVWYSDITEPGA